MSRRPVSNRPTNEPEIRVPPRPKSADEVLDHLQVAIEANRKAARSVILKGQVSVTRKLVSPAVDPSKSDERSRGPQYEINGPFRFIADDAGRKRWTRRMNRRASGSTRPGHSMAMSSAMQRCEPWIPQADQRIPGGAVR